MNALFTKTFVIKTILVLVATLPLPVEKTTNLPTVKKDTVLPYSAPKIPNKPEYIVVAFIEALGKQDFQKAYSLQNVRAWGSFQDFSSPKKFGDVRQTKVYTFSDLGSIKVKNGQYTHRVWVHYLKVVPLKNKYVLGGKMKENFHVSLQDGEWKIVEVIRA